MSKIIYESELYHHGILGQKWGIRRFQNKDGSLTTAGKKRVDSKTDSDQKNEASSKSSSPHKKSISEMSDEELTAAIARKKLEEQYKEYMYPKEAKKYFNGKEFISDIITRQGKEILSQTAKYMMAKGINKLFGDEVVRVGKDSNNERVEKVTSTTLKKGQKLSDISDAELSNMVNRINNERTIKKSMEKPSSSLNKLKDVDDISQIDDETFSSILKRVNNERLFDDFVKRATEKKSEKKPEEKGE